MIHTNTNRMKDKDIKKLTAAEEQIMQVLWQLQKAFVKEIIAELPEPKPAYNTVSTIVRILEGKGFAGHEAFGKSHRYFPLITKEEYSDFFMKSFISSYFSGSFEKMVSFFVKKNNVQPNDMESLLKHLEEARKNKEGKK